ncbi:hypothetical protein GGR53DRAFT_486970 [Hypoxylon sp. FL1150]|nr:hypothetical protein GGR53DRAFT_486970 [Hypoxylon sp. FL1150]
MRFLSLFDVYKRQHSSPFGFCLQLSSFAILTCGIVKTLLLYFYNSHLLYYQNLYPHITMRSPLLLVVGFTAALGDTTPVNHSDPSVIKNEPRRVVEGRCQKQLYPNEGVCYEDFDHKSGWTGNCDPPPYRCTSTGNYCSLSTVPGGVVMCT